MLAFALYLAAVTVLMAIVVETVTKQAAAGEMGPNGLAGIRTRATRRSPEAWRAAHAAAQAPLRQGTQLGLGVVGLGVVLALVGRFTSDTVSLTGAIAVGVGFGVVIAGVLWAAYVADRAARRV